MNQELKKMNEAKVKMKEAFKLASYDSLTQESIAKASDTLTSSIEKIQKEEIEIKASKQ